MGREEALAKMEAKLATAKKDQISRSRKRKV